nr:NACHT, LRR and PYD domains-containing protein 2 [Marmota flaviventris]
MPQGRLGQEIFPFHTTGPPQRQERLSLRVAKGVLPEEEVALELDALDGRSQSYQDLHLSWSELCSVFSSNKSLVFLDISHSFLSSQFVRTLCDQLASANCCLQKVILKNISPAGAYQNLCLAFGGHKTLTHLTLEGSELDDVLSSLRQVLSHWRCKLQCLRLGPCSAPVPEWADLFLTLQFNHSLTCLDLSDSELLDEGAKLLCAGLRYPTCPVQRLSLENCQLTEACCKEVSVTLVVSQRLTHLCLAKNDLGDDGVKTLCEGLRYPSCQLQALVLWCCSIASEGCGHLSTVLRQGSSLTQLDLGLNHVGVPGLKALCEALKAPQCGLQRLWLWGCSLTPFSCQDLSYALSCNRSLVTLDLGQNSLGFHGVKMLCDALRLQNCPLQTLRLKIEESDTDIQNLLREIKESNPRLAIDGSRRDPQRHRPSADDFLF